jgi:hypothetical protein
MLFCSACGRIGFERITGSDQAQRRHSAAPGNPADAQVDGAMVARMDGGGDSGTPRAAMDAATDALTGPADGAPLAAAADAAGDGGLDASMLEDDGGALSTDAGACTTTQVTDYCTELPHLGVVPQIDGQLECDLQLHDITPVGWSNAMNSLPAGQSARLAAAWREDGLYFFLDVTDASRLPPETGADIWCGDGPEIYIDSDGTFAAAPKYDVPGAVQILAKAPADSSTPVRTGAQRFRKPNDGVVARPWTSSRYGAFPRPGGYVFEAFVAADDIDLSSWTLAAGGMVGFDAAINVSVSTAPPPPSEKPDCGRRLGQYFLHTATAPCATSCMPFDNAAAFCAPVLRP